MAGGIILPENLTSPATPDAGYQVLYLKNDGNFYLKDSTGEERIVFMGDALIRTAKIDISSAELLTAHSSPILVLAAPGANKTNVIIMAAVHYKAGTVAYNFIGGGQFDFFYGDISLANYATLINGNGYSENYMQLTDTLLIYPNALSGIGMAAVNEGIYWASDPDDLADGDGTMTITVHYITIDLS